MPNCSKIVSMSLIRRAKRRASRLIDVDSIDENRLLLLEDGHCLKDHALSACNRPELRANAAMMGTSLHTLVQMVDNGLGLTFIPAMAIQAGILDGTGVDAKPLRSDHGFRRIALIWRRSSPRENEFQLLADSLREIVREVIPATVDRADIFELRPIAARRGVGRNECRGRPKPKLFIAGSSCCCRGHVPRVVRTRSKRSAFMTFVQAATKSRTNFSSLPFSA